MAKNSYTPRTPRLLFILLSLVSLFIVESIYLSISKTTSQDVQNKREKFVQLSSLPDLAISTEASYIRHRSMVDIFAIYKDDGSLREYFPSTYTYSHSHTINGGSNEQKN